MFNRKLKRRLKSLEQFLGVVFSPKDTKDDYDEHMTDEYGRMVDFNKMQDEFYEKKKKKK